jgi:hypothetical protein
LLKISGAYVIRELDADDGLLRKTLYDDMSPIERADYVYKAACQ